MRLVVSALEVATSPGALEEAALQGDIALIRGYQIGERTPLWLPVSAYGEVELILTLTSHLTLRRIQPSPSSL